MVFFIHALTIPTFLVSCFSYLLLLDLQKARNFFFSIDNIGDQTSLQLLRVHASVIREAPSNLASHNLLFKQSKNDNYVHTRGYLFYLDGLIGVTYFYGYGYVP